MDRGNGDGSINDLPWATVFDPAANARAFSAIQAEGFRAASEIVDRFARMAATGLGGKDPSATRLTNDQRADLFGATDIEPLIRSWWVMIGQFLLGVSPSSGNGVRNTPDGPDHGASFDFSNNVATGRISLGAAVPGSAAAEVWLHNRGAADLGQIRLRCSDLLADDGSVISAGAVALEPATVAMPARSSRGINVKIEVPQGVVPGVYRGTVLVEGHSELWLPVVLTVRPPAP